MGQRKASKQNLGKKERKQIKKLVKISSTSTNHPLFNYGLSIESLSGNDFRTMQRRMFNCSISTPLAMASPLIVCDFLIVCYVAFFFSTFIMDQWLASMWNDWDQSRDEENVEDDLLNAVQRPLTVFLSFLSI
jgi:hypothetical protein